VVRECGVCATHWQWQYHREYWLHTGSTIVSIDCIQAVQLWALTVYRFWECELSGLFAASMPSCILLTSAASPCVHVAWLPGREHRGSGQRLLLTGFRQGRVKTR
jgi:hypothetical protein